MNETFTYNQVNQQESSAYRNRSGDQPTVLVKRTDGRVTVGRLDKETRDVSFTEDGQELMKPEVPMLELSDQRQMELAEELAGKPLHDNEVNQETKNRLNAEQKLGGRALHQQVERPQPSLAEQLQLRLDAIGQKYDREASLNLWRYASGMMNKRDAQRAGDGQASMDYHQQAGQAIRELEKVSGPDARKDAEDYLSLMQQLQSARDR